MMVSDSAEPSVHASSRPPREHDLVGAGRADHDHRHRQQGQDIGGHAAEQGPPDPAAAMATDDDQRPLAVLGRVGDALGGPVGLDDDGRGRQLIDRGDQVVEVGPGLRCVTVGDHLQ